MSSPTDTNQASEDELDELCPICEGTTWQMNADYEEVPCWHDIHDEGFKQAILDWHNKQVAKARIDELTYWPLNWALNRKDETWEQMIRSRIAELSQTLKEHKELLK